MLEWGEPSRDPQRAKGKGHKGTVLRDRQMRQDKETLLPGHLSMEETLRDPWHQRRARGPTPFTPLRMGMSVFPLLRPPMKPPAKTPSRIPQSPIPLIWSMNGYKGAASTMVDPIKFLSFRGWCWVGGNNFCNFWFGWGYTERMLDNLKNIGRWLSAQWIRMWMWIK